MQPVKLGILGLGTVGAGTINVIADNSREIGRRAGREIQVTIASARDITKERECNLEGIELTTDSLAVVNHPDVDVVVELIGGETLAKDLVLQAIANGKHVVTANKALIALHGAEIFAKAQEQGVTVAFEAAVAGGIPIIKAIREGLAGNHIEWLAGIINGTTNFILTEMQEKDRPFGDVLAEAQALGYAEADPTFDVEGIDAAHKLTILAAIAFGMPLRFDRAYTEGITKITSDDVTFAEELGYRIKHLGIARRRVNGVELRVHPTLVPERELLGNVNGVLNAVLVQADAVGPTLYTGAGAGSLATASAVVADIVDVVRALTVDPTNRVPHLAFQPDAIDELNVLDAAEFECGYYLRATVSDEPGVMAEISGVLAQQGVNIEAIIQKEPREGEHEVQIIMLTRRTKEAAINDAIATIQAMPAVAGDVVRIRVETLSA